MISPASWHPRTLKYARFVAGLSLLFGWPLLNLAAFALKDELFSYILLIPFIAVYLANLNRHKLPDTSPAQPAAAVGFALMGLTALAYWFLATRQDYPLRSADGLAPVVFCYFSWLIGGGFLFLGKAWMKPLAFPLGMLVFLVPFPTAATNGIEQFFQKFSADASALFFTVSGTTFARAGQVFQLPGITIEVAQECSGVRSSLVLFITSLIAGHLFLRTAGLRWLLALFVIPLGIFRNAFRIFTIAQLCIHIDPNMIHSYIHHKGGPIFFVLSLFPFFLALFFLRWWERGRETAPIPPQ